MKCFESLKNSQAIVDKIIILATTPIYQKAYEPYIKTYSSLFVKNTNKLLTNLLVNSSAPLEDPIHFNLKEPVILI